MGRKKRPNGSPLCASFAASGQCNFGAQCWFIHTTGTELDGRTGHLPQEDRQIGEFVEEDFQLRIVGEEVAEKCKAVFMQSFRDLRLVNFERRILDLENELIMSKGEASELRLKIEGLQLEVQDLKQKGQEAEAELSLKRHQLEVAFNGQVSSSSCRGAPIARLAAEWQFKSAPGEWSLLPADRSKTLHEHFEQFSKGADKLVRLKSGVEEYDFDFALMKQKNIRTLKERPIRCLLPTPRHWTRCVDLEHIYQLTSGTALEISGFKRESLNGIYAKSDHESMNDHSVWWKLCGSTIAYKNKEGAICLTFIVAVSTTKDHKADYLTRVRSGANLASAYFEFGQDLLHAGGVCKEWIGGDFEETPGVKVSPRPSIGLVPFMSIAVEVEAGNLYSLLIDAFVQTSMHSVGFQGQSACADFKRQLVIARLLRVENWPLFNKYCSHLQHMKADLQKYNIRLESVEPRLSYTLTCLANAYSAGLDEGVNECLLFHGAASFEEASEIAREGFDFRLSRPGYYCHEIYLSSQACKSNQYTRGNARGSLRTMIVSRVAIGDICYAAKGDQACRRPPRRPGTSRCYDTASHKPGPMPGHTKRVQTHQEFIIFEKFQAYPEFIVQYYLRNET